MHEVSLIQNLMDIVCRSAKENDINQVTRIKLVIGEMHGVLPEALDFAFQVLTRDTACEGAALDVEHVPLILGCNDCGKEFRQEGISRRCPYCGSLNTGIISGRELYIDYYEGD